MADNSISQSQIQKNKRWIEDSRMIRKKHNIRSTNYFVEGMNRQVNDSIERGHNPSWVLADMAGHLKLKAVQSEDPKYLEMINYLGTQKGSNSESQNLLDIGPNNYGATLKGKKIIQEGMKEIRANQLKKEKDSIKQFNYSQKVLENHFTVKASQLLQKKSLMTKEEFKKQWDQLWAHAADVGKVQILKQQEEIFSAVATPFREITDEEFQDSATKLIKDVDSKDLLDYDYENYFRQESIVLTEKQQKNLKDRVDSLKEYKNVPEIKKHLEDTDGFLNDFETELDQIEADKDPTASKFGISKHINRVKRNLKRKVANKIKEIYLDVMGDEGFEGNPRHISLWGKDDQERFYDRLNKEMSLLFPKRKKGKDGQIIEGLEEGAIYNELKKAYEDAPKPVLERDKNAWIKTLRAEKGNLLVYKDSGYPWTSGNQILLDRINKDLQNLDPEGEESFLKSTEGLKDLKEARLVTRRSRKPEDVQALSTIRKQLIDGAMSGNKDIAKDNVENVLAESGIRLGPSAKAQYKRWVEAIVAPEDTHASARVSKLYGNLVRSIFPGFVEGFLTSALRFDTEKKLEKVPRKAVTEIDKATEKARRIIEELFAKETESIQKPYKLWSRKQKNTFADKVKQTLTADNGVFGRKHLEKLNSFLPQGEERKFDYKEFADEFDQKFPGRIKSRTGQPRKDEIAQLIKDGEVDSNTLSVWYNTYVGGKATKPKEQATAIIELFLNPKNK